MKYEFLGYPENFEKHPLEKLISKYVKWGPVLDVGCGNGNLLSILKKDFEVEGFDISDIAVKLANKRGLNVKISDVNNFKTPKKFKTILLIGFLVLSKNPGEDLKKISKWLDQDGVIMLTIPNSTSPKTYYRLFKKGLYHFYFPSYFGFKNFLKENNFEVIKCVGAGKLSKIPVLDSVIFYIIKPKKSPSS